MNQQTLLLAAWVIFSVSNLLAIIELFKLTMAYYDWRQGPKGLTEQQTMLLLAKNRQQFVIGLMVLFFLVFQLADQITKTFFLKGYIIIMPIVASILLGLAIAICRMVIEFLQWRRQKRQQSTPESTG